MQKGIFERSRMASPTAPPVEQLHGLSGWKREQLVHYHEARGEYMIGNLSLGRFPEMYMTLEGTPFANCPALLVVIALLVVAGCVAPPLYVYRRKIYYKLVMVVYRRRKDKLARELKKRMKVYTEDPTYPLDSGSRRNSETSQTCLICMDPLLDSKTTDLVILLDVCKHRFHFKCILKWLDMSDGCPICRKTVDVNDRQALRLVYSDCRPKDPPDKAVEETNVDEDDVVEGEDAILGGDSSAGEDMALTHHLSSDSHSLRSGGLDLEEYTAVNVTVDINTPTEQVQPPLQPSTQPSSHTHIDMLPLTAHSNLKAEQHPHCHGNDISDNVSIHSETLMMTSVDKDYQDKYGSSVISTEDVKSTDIIDNETSILTASPSHSVLTLDDNQPMVLETDLDACSEDIAMDAACSHPSHRKHSFVKLDII